MQTTIEIWQTIVTDLSIKIPSDRSNIRLTKWWVTNQDNIRTESAMLVFHNVRNMENNHLSYSHSQMLDIVQIHNENLLIGMTPEQYLDSIK